MFTRVDAADSASCADMRVNYLEIPEPPPVLSAVLPDDYSPYTYGDPVDLLRAMEARYEVDWIEHRVREQARTAELGYARATLQYLQDQQRPRKLPRKLETGKGT